jgi:hypothetical protein
MLVSPWLKYGLARIIAVALIAFAALSFVSYAVYAHQSMRHLGNPTEQNGYWSLRAKKPRPERPGLSWQCQAHPFRPMARLVSTRD